MTFTPLKQETFLAIYDQISVTFSQKSSKPMDVSIVNAIYEGINIFHDYKKDCDIADIGSHLAYSILREKPFPLHNRKVTIVALEVFLNINNYSLSASDPFLLINLKDLETQEISEKDFAIWLRRHINIKKV